MLTSERLCREKSQHQNLWLDHTPGREERRGGEKGKRSRERKGCDREGIKGRKRRKKKGERG